MGKILHRALVTVLLLGGLVQLSACSATPRPASGMTLHNECVQIAERTSRTRCLELAARAPG